MIGQIPPAQVRSVKSFFSEMISDEGECGRREHTGIVLERTYCKTLTIPSEIRPFGNRS